MRPKSCCARAGVVSSPVSFCQVTVSGVDPVNYKFHGEHGEPHMAGATFKKITVDFQDGRDVPLTLEQNGFALRAHTSRMTASDFWTEDRVLEGWYPQCSQLVRDTLEEAGVRVKKVVSFDHNIRSVDRVGESLGTTLFDDKLAKANFTARTINPVAKVAHNDYTALSAKKRVTELGQSRENGGSHTISTALINAEDVDSALGEGGFAFINVWRNIDDMPIENNHFALIDAQTIVEEDFITVKQVYPDRTGEICFVQHQPDRHRWYYFDAMTPDEVILLKCFDSTRENFSAHASFRDPGASTTARPRQSIEVRTLVLFEAKERERAKL